MALTFWEGFNKRWKQIRAIHKQYMLFYWLFGGAVVLLTLVWIGTLLFVGKEDPGYKMNLFTEGLGVFVSIGITVLIIDRLDERRSTQRLKRRLVREVGSGSNEFAKNAVSWLRAEKWLEDDNGLLRESDLNWADLRGANLRKVNLQGAQLIEAKLHDAIFHGANLQEAWLINARLRGAELQGADLRFVDLEDAELEGAKLPDGTIYCDNTDMERFTNPNHFQYKITLKQINWIRGGLDAKPLCLQ